MTIFDEFRTFLLIPLCAGIGIIIAMITEVLYDRSIVIDSYITGSINLAQVQSMIIIMFILLGIMLGVLSKR